MPEFRKLSEEELNSLRGPMTGERARIREEYRGYLSGLSVGEGGEMNLAEDEKKVTIKNRLKRAAEELGVKLEFKRSGPDVVRFRIASKNENA